MNFPKPTKRIKKRKGLHKIRKTSRAGIIRKLDKRVSQIIIEREGRCVICGSTTSLGAGHIFSRRAYNTRWDLTKEGNVHVQCWPCNFRHTYDSYPYFMWYRQKFGQQAFSNLYERFRTPTKLTTKQLEMMLEALKS